MDASARAEQIVAAWKQRLPSVKDLHFEEMLVTAIAALAREVAAETWEAAAELAWRFPPCTCPTQQSHVLSCRNYRLVEELRRRATRPLRGAQR